MREYLKKLLSNRKKNITTTTPDNDHELQAEITGIIFKQIPINSLAVVINCLILIYVLWNIIDNTTLIAWFSANLVVFFSRMFIRNIYYRNPQKSHKDIIKWQNIFFITTVISGFVFGSAGIFMFKKEFIEYNVFIYFVIGGMAAGSTGTYAIKLKFYFAYFIPLFFPATINFFLIGGTLNTAMGSMGILFFVILLITVFRMRKVTINSLTLSFQNRALLDTISKEKQQIEKLNLELKEISLVDPMTGLKNRRFYSEVILEEASVFQSRFIYALAKKNSRRNMIEHIMGIFIINIDFFKNVNDKYGHDAGDLVLKQFSKILTEESRADDLIIRWGGEEFLIVLRKTDFEFLTFFAERLRKRITNTSFVLSDNNSISLNCSIGYLPFPLTSDEPDLISFEKSINLADLALYYAKDEGRNLSVGIFPRASVSLSKNDITDIISNFRDNLDKVEIKISGR